MLGCSSIFIKLMSGQTSEVNMLQQSVKLKDLQIKSLLALTQAINNNVPAADLFEMFKSFLGYEMQVGKMALFVQEHDRWACVSSIKYEAKGNTDFLYQLLRQYKRTERVKPEHEDALHQFNVVIPVYHKKKAIAFVLIGEGDGDPDFYNKIHFITTITNVIAVAIENKRLFKRQLEQERIRREMELAGDVQQFLIPERMPRQKGFELSSIYRPHSNIGGDYFDYIKISDHKYLIAIADISGKGVPAALLMSNFQAYLRTLSLSYDGLASLIPLLNHSVYSNTRSDRYLTLFIAEYDIASGSMHYVNAGHPTPYLFTKDEVIALDQGCTLIGAFESLPALHIGSLTIDDPATLLCYTDGLSDIANSKGDYFDESKIINFIKKNAHRSAFQFNDLLLSEIDDFIEDNNYPDDIAILTAKLDPNLS